MEGQTDRDESPPATTLFSAKDPIANEREFGTVLCIVLAASIVTDG